MLDRILKTIIAGTFFCLLIQCVVGILCRTASVVFAATGAGLHGLGSLLGAVLTVLVMLFLTVGLLVRAGQFLRQHNPRAAREQAARERARTRVRRPAEEVPSHRPPVEVEDPDPALGEADEDREE